MDIKNAAARLRDRSSWVGDFVDTNQHVEDIVKLFDYPHSEIKRLSQESQEMMSPEMVAKLFDRHMKLTYDSFGGLRDVDQNYVANIMLSVFAEFKRSQGWPMGRGTYPCPNRDNKIDTEKLRYVLSEKFSAARSRSLAAAIKALEAQIKLDIEEQVKEEHETQDHSAQDSPEAIKRGGR